MRDFIGSVCIIDGEEQPTAKLENIDIRGVKAVYDVIRIIDEVPLFYEDHYERLKGSLKMLELDTGVSRQELEALIEKLLRKNKLISCNVKVIILDGERDGQRSILYISRSYYPSLEEYTAGVPVSLMHMERENPNAKVINMGYRERAVQWMKERKAFEALLVNQENKITEGSKSNVFFVKGSRVCNAADAYVLKGITRKYVLEACRRVGVQVDETLVDTASLKEIDGLFISGTSIKVLPVSSVDGYRYDSSSNPVISAVRSQFDRLVEEYVMAHKKYRI